MKRLGHALVWSLFGASCLVSACSEDSDGQTPSDTDGGSESAGGPGTAGGTTGGSAVGGGAGTTLGGASSGGAAHAGEGGDGGVSGEAGSPAQGGDGSGGAGSEELVYSCEATTQAHRVCSALVAANCPEATDCADCVTTRTGDRELFASCASCVAEYDAFEQCGIDAFESGNLSAGVECYEGFGADLNDNCAGHLQQAIACSDYEAEHGCPAAWPLPG